MILLAGGFGRDALGFIKEFPDFSYENCNIVVNGLLLLEFAELLSNEAGICVYVLEKCSSFLERIEINQKRRKIINCAYFSKNLGNFNFETLKIPDKKINNNLFCELLDIETGIVSLKKITYLKEAVYYSLLHPGILPPCENKLNSMLFTSSPFLSVSETENETIYFYEKSHSLPSSNTIEEIFKTTLYIRSEILKEIILKRISKNNNLIILI